MALSSTAQKPLSPDLMRLIASGWHHHQNSNWADAARDYKKVLKKAPDNADTLHLLGLVRMNQQRVEDAVALFRASLDRKPDDAKAWYNLALALVSLRRNSAAADAMRRAAALNPGLDDVVSRFIDYRRGAADWRDYGDQLRFIREGADPSKPQVRPFLSLLLDDPQLQLEVARRFARDKGYGALAKFQHTPATRRPGRIRVAYLCEDFRDHAGAFLFAQVPEHHDHGRFEIFAVALGADSASPYRARIKAGADQWIDCGTEPAHATAQRLRDLGIDILVDMIGYTGARQLEISAARPAPIQVSYLTYPGTSGTTFLDYIIADSHVAPLELAPFLSEAIVHLPETYQPNGALFQLPPCPSRAEAGLPEEGIVFGAFNAIHKLDPEMFDIWARLLARVPNSVIWMLESGHGERENLARELEARGLSPARIVYAPRCDLNLHLTRLPLADLGLDTFPCTGHTTASDMIRMGLPVVTRTGKTFASRVAGGLLAASGLGELVARDAEEYEAIASRLALDPQALAATRARALEARSTSPLFKPERYVRHLEAAYEQMMARWLAGEAPGHFAVPPLG